MSHRYSRTDKGKWQEDRLPPRKPLVRIPESNVAELIESNKFTFIGRVTNPSIQKTRALVDFFLQHWNVVGKITGRPLGPQLFQFSFESEKDLQAILSKSPFHFKRWMMILQRWEPVVSDNFPNRVTFWINIHGIPLHYWNDATINAIGEALGPIDTREVDKARLRVRINGLKPLIMRMDIELPSKDVIEVELEYEKLEKHCFHCKSLSHEYGECHYQPPARLSNGERRHTNAAQQTTLERIEEGKKRQAERKHARMQHSHHHEGARWTNYRTSNTKEYRPISHGTSSRNSSGSSSVYEENRRRYDDRNLPSVMIPSHKKNLPMRGSQERAPAPHDWQSRNLPAPEPRGSRNSQSSPASSNPKGTPSSALGEGHQRSNIASRLSDPRNSMASSEERLPAKERLSVHTQRTNSKEQRVSSNASSQDRLPALKRLSGQGAGEPHSNTQRMQEFETQLEDSLPPVSNGIIVTRPSSSNLFDSGRLGPGERSPIRTLSEDRVHVSLRLGPLLADTEEDTELDQPILSKAEGKKKVGEAQTRKRIARAPTQGVSVKKRRVSKTQNSPRRSSPRRNPPRRKLMMDAIVAGGGGLSGVSRSTPRGSKIIPAMVKKGKDFHPLPKSLP